MFARVLGDDEDFAHESLDSSPLEELYPGSVGQSPPHVVGSDEERAKAARALTEVADASSSASGFPEGQDAVSSSDGVPWPVPRLGKILATAAAGTISPSGQVFGHRPQPRFVALQRWEGYVEERTPDSFVARLVDVGDARAAEEEAEILLSEVSEDDLELVTPGAVFYWAIGYRDQPTGQRERVSTIRFRRLPGLTESDVQRARERAREIGKRVGWD